MTSIRGRGRGIPSSGAGPGPRGGGPDGAGQTRRGSWRGGPPGTNGGPKPPNIPRQSISEQAIDPKKSEGVARPVKGFQTDTAISNVNTSNTAPRELKPWVPDGPPEPALPAQSQFRSNGSQRDAQTFGSATGSWDQFETNARLFGTTSTWAEEIYTTKLDRNTPDYKKREKEAEKLANEIMGQTSNDSHIAEERGQASTDDKDEEEKYSGVVRKANAYVPPGARKGPVAVSAIPPRPSPANPAAPASAPVVPKTNGKAPAQAPTTPAADVVKPAPAISSPAPPPAAASVPTATLPIPTQPIKNGPSKTATEEKPASIPTPSAITVKAASPVPDKASLPADSKLTAAMAATDSKDRPGVLDSFRQFVGTERERVEAKKNMIAKTERERQLAALKDFQLNFKVPLPVPKDMLPILTKDEEKQKAIEAQAAASVTAAKEKKANAAAAASASLSPKLGTKVADPKLVTPQKKTPMKISEIPPFSGKKKEPFQPPALPIPETANANIPLAVSPGPSESSTTQAAKLNPQANSFVFKPNPGAASFKPGQASSSTAAIPAATTASPAVAPAKTQPAAGPSQPTYKNPFFREPPRRIAVNARDDFNPWRHAPVAPAASVPASWPYTGRKFSVFSGSAHLGGGAGMAPGLANDDEIPGSNPHSLPPHILAGMPPNYPPYGYRYQPGPPSMSPMGSSPMFSPVPGYAPLPGQMSHMGGPPPNGLPMYFQNGMPPNPQFLPPQHMHFNPSTPQRPGHGPIPQGPAGMYYPQQQMSSPHQTPQMHNNMPFPPQPFSLPMPPNGHNASSQGGATAAPAPSSGGGPSPPGAQGTFESPTPAAH